MQQQDHGGRPQSTPSGSVVGPTKRPSHMASSLTSSPARAVHHSGGPPPLPVKAGTSATADPLQMNPPEARRPAQHSPSPERLLEHKAEDDESPATPSGADGSSVFVASTTKEPPEVRQPSEGQQTSPALSGQRHTPAARSEHSRTPPAEKKATRSFTGVGPLSLPLESAPSHPAKDVHHTARTDRSIPPVHRPGRPALSDQQQYSDLEFSSAESNEAADNTLSILEGVSTTESKPPKVPVLDRSRRASSTAPASAVAGSSMLVPPPARTIAAEDTESTFGVGRHRKQFNVVTEAGEDETKGQEVEHLMPLHYRPTHPADQFFVHFIDRPNNLYDLEAGHHRLNIGDTKVSTITPPRNEEEMMLEQFAEFTDDDSFFSSGSSVLSETDHRMEETTRLHATSNVKDTLLLRSLKAGYDAPEEARQHWLYQVHHRAICLNYSSFYLFPARWTPRVVVYNILHHWAMELLLAGTIFAYAIFQACWARTPTPFMGSAFSRPDYMILADVLFTALLCVEVFFRLFACGLVLHPRSFLRSPWHWLDVAVLILMVMTCTTWRSMWNFTSWRLIRIIKCCRYFPTPVRLKILAKAFLRSTARLFGTTLFLAWFLFFFALLGLHLFNGELQNRCVNDVTGATTTQICNPRATGKYWFYWGHQCDTGYTCVHISGDNPHFSFRSFDDIGHAFLSTFQVLTFQGWTGLLTETNDAMNTLAFLYYMFVILVCAWVIPALYIGVFMETLLLIKRRFLFKQVSTFEAIVNEQCQRQNASICLLDYVARDVDGTVPRYPNYDKHIMEEKVERGWHKPLSDLHWTDEGRIQLHLAITRQAQFATSGLLKENPNGHHDASGAGQVGGEHGPKPYGNSGEARAVHSEFVLGGAVGELQHHLGKTAIGEEPGNHRDFAARQKAAVAEYPFLESYRIQKEKEALRSAVKLHSTRGEAMRSASAASKVSVIPPLPMTEIPEQRILKTTETPGVTPQYAVGEIPSSDNSILKQLNSEEEDLELVVHDPEGGDFRYTTKLNQRWGIIRNMVHMSMEGYPRIITHYLWEYRRMQQRYRLRPLEYTSKYEADVLQLLRRQRLEELRDRDSQMRRLPAQKSTSLERERGEDDQDLHQWSAQDETALLENPVSMARNIYGNAPPTVANITMYVFIFANAVCNAARYNNMPQSWDDALFYISVCFSAIFTLELLLHVVALGPGPFLHNGFYPLELLFVVLSLFELGFDRSNAISVFNWIRFLRLTRVSPIVPLKQATRVLLIAFPDLLISLIFFSIYMFMWVLIGMSFFGSRFADLAPGDYSTRGNFNSFSYALYAVAQAFSINRDQWLYLSWSGMRARGGYTIIYFMATTLVAFIFRFLFIAICTSAWQTHFERIADLTVEKVSSAMEPVLRRRLAQLRQRPWFDFTVWRSFKHLHGGFQRRDIAPDDVYHLNPDMRQYLRAAEARSHHFQQLYATSQEEVAADADHGNAKDVRFINVGGRLHRQYAKDAGEGVSEATLSFLSQGQVKEQESLVESVPALVAPYCNDCAFNPPAPEPAAAMEPNRFRHIYSNQNLEVLMPNPIHADRHSLAPSFPWREERRKDMTSSSACPLPTWSAANSRGVSMASHRLAEWYPSAPGVSAQLYSLLRSPEEEPRHDSEAGAKRQVPTHLLLPGPLMKPHFKPLDGFQRMMDRCRECNSFKQIPLPHAKGVARRDADDLHREHCHMAAVRSARQTVLDSILGFVEVQIEHEVPPTKEMIETILGQAWSCGLLMFETLENVFDEKVRPAERSWKNMLDSLKLQKWITGLQVGEEQVGRSALAYLLAHQAREDQLVSLRNHEAPFKAAERPNSIWNNDKSFFFLSRSNKFRTVVGEFVHSIWFESVVLCVIFFASICLAIYTPGNDNLDMGGTYNSNKYKVLHGLDDFFTVLFGIEVILRCISDGVVLPVKKAYFWHLWNIFDFFIVVISVVSWVDHSVHLRYLKVFRCFRLVGFMRESRWPNIHVLAHGLWTAVPTIANVCLIMLGNYVVWAIIFSSMFSAKMSKCTNSSITIKKACESQGYQWVSAYERSFSNFYESLLTTFEISTGAEWMDVMYQAVDSWATYATPTSNRHPYLGIVFIAYYYISHFVLFGLLTSSIIHWYIKNRSAMVGVEETASPSLARWQRMRSMLSCFAPRVKLLPMSNCVSRAIHEIVTHWYFEVVMGMVIVLNALTMSLEWYDMHQSQKDALDALQYVFIACFTVEIILRLSAHGLNTTTNHYVPFNVNVLRLLRVGRLLSLLMYFETAHSYAKLLYICILSAVWDVFAVGCFFVLSVLVFAVAGLHMLGYIVPYGEYISYPYNNFYTYVNSIIMVFRLSTLENWATMLRDSMEKGNYCANGKNCGPTNWAPIYYIALLLCCVVLAGSLFMAVILYHYLTLSRMHRDISRWHDLYCLREAWTQQDPNATGVLPVALLPTILEKLRHPLGISNRFNRVELLELLRSYHIPEKKGVVRYDDVLQAVARRVIAIAIAEKDVGATRRKDGFEKSWKVVELKLAVFDEERNEAEIRQLALGFVHLPTTAAKELNTFQPQRPEDDLSLFSKFTVEEYFAVSYIQAAYRRDKATRHALIERAHLWRRGRQVCDAQNLPYDQYGFSHYTLDGPDPALEGNERGFAMDKASEYETPRPGTSGSTAAGDHLYPAPTARSRRVRAESATAARRRPPPAQASGAYALLPEMYKTAIHPPLKRFGPGAKGAIQRGERRSDKLAKDAVNRTPEPRRHSTTSAFSQRSGEQTDRSSNSNFDVSETSENSSEHGYQPPLGTDLEALRSVDLRRRARHTHDKYRAPDGKLD